MTTKVMTYQELGELLQIEPASAKRLALRKKWPKHLGNDGKARVTVPLEEMPERGAGDDTGEVSGDVAAHARPHAAAAASDDTDVVTATVAVLTNHIKRLEREIEALKEEREAERERLEGRAGALEEKVTALEQDLAAERLRGTQLNSLNAVIEAERKRSADLQAERDRWASQAERLADTPKPEARRSWWPFRRVG